MAGANKKAQGKTTVSKVGMVLNKEDAPAYAPTDPRMALYLRSCASFLEDKFYESASEEAQALKVLIAQAGRSFTLKLASYARQAMHLRSLPVMLLAEAAALVKGKPSEDGVSQVRQYAPRILKRADEPAELIAYWLKSRGSKRNFPNALKKGISDAMRKFDEYQLAKYKGDSNAVKLRDAIAIAHPRAGKKHDLAEPHKKGTVKAWQVDETERERFDLYGRAFTGQLATPDTWETYISANGSTAETWDHIAPSMGIFALVRNLRNFEEKGAKTALQIAINAMHDEVQVRKSQMLPFRWLAAMKATSSSMVQDALRDAMELSVANLPRWSGATAVFSDNSASMHSAVSAKSTVERSDIAGLMSAIAAQITEGEYGVGVFGDSFKWVKISKRDSILSNAHKITTTDVGHSTHAYLAIQAMVKDKLSIDRVILFSDMQCYASGSGYGWLGGPVALETAWKEYLAKVNPKAMLYSVDLAGYGTMQFQESDPSVVQLAGFSDQTIRLIPALEGRQTAVEVIEKDW